MTEEENKKVNEMRLTFVHQIDELIDMLWHYEAKMLGVDEPEGERIRGCIAYAKKVTNCYRYNGPYREKEDYKVCGE